MSWEWLTWYEPVTYVGVVLRVERVTAVIAASWSLVAVLVIVETRCPQTEPQKWSVQVEVGVWFCLNPVLSADGDHVTCNAQRQAGADRHNQRQTRQSSPRHQVFLHSQQQQPLVNLTLTLTLALAADCDYQRQAGADRHNQRQTRQSSPRYDTQWLALVHCTLSKHLYNLSIFRHFWSVMWISVCLLVFSFRF